MKSAINGKVYLVGAGPGDPDLLTVKAHGLIRAAEMILHDDLVTPEILAFANPRALVLNVGKRCGAKTITQHEINQLMIASAHRGLHVVRLKSGDPAIFGRLAEERDALEAAGVAYEIVPGVTAALGAAAELNVSLTDRRASSRIIIVSAHRAHENAAGDDAPVDWRGLANQNATLVIYMPGRDFTGLESELLASGITPGTPAVIVSRATTPDQRHFFTAVGRLREAPSLEPPTILLIGPTIAQNSQPDTASPSLAWASLPEASEIRIGAAEANHISHRSFTL
jgi:uroporphyrin-III C-methyltransferase